MNPFVRGAGRRVEIQMRLRLPRLLLASVLFASLAGGSSAALAAPVLYSQPGQLGDAWLSEDVGVNPPTWRVFDDFALGSDATIRRVRFVGGYVDLSNSVYPAPDSFAFAFRIFADAPGVPGGPAALLHEETVAFADMTTSFLGVGSYGGFRTSGYEFMADLPVGFAAAGATQYWLAISSVAPAGAVQWAWFSGTGGDGTSLQVNNGITSYWHQRDRAFTLEAVPEPATLVLLGAGLLGIARHKRRDRRLS